MDYVRIDNSIKSSDFEGVELLNYKLTSLTAPFQRQSERSERLLLRQGAGQYREQALTFEFAIVGSSVAECYNKAFLFTKKLKNAQCAEISELEGIIFRGYVGEIVTTEQEERWLRVEVKFNLNPPCACRLLGNASTILLPKIAPLAEQISESNASYNIKLTEAKKLQLPDDASSPEIYAMLIGSWDTLKIGGLELPKVMDQIVYIDAETEQVYIKLDARRVNILDIKGAFKLVNAQNEIDFSGENLNLTAHIYVVERI